MKGAGAALLPSTKEMFYSFPKTAKELFQHREGIEIHLRIYLAKPDKIKSLESLKAADSRICEEIEGAEQYIKLLQDYRQEIFKRSQVITSATFSPVLMFWRSKNYYENKVYYYIALVDRYSDKSISDKAKFTEKFEGKERAKAFARFKQLKKQFPNIQIEQNTDKAQWER